MATTQTISNTEVFPHVQDYDLYASGDRVMVTSIDSLGVGIVKDVMRCELLGNVKRVLVEFTNTQVWMDVDAVRSVYS